MPKLRSTTRHLEAAATQLVQELESKRNTAFAFNADNASPEGASKCNGQSSRLFIPETAYAEAEEHLARLVAMHGDDPTKALAFLRSIAALGLHEPRGFIRREPSVKCRPSSISSAIHDVP